MSPGTKWLGKWNRNPYRVIKKIGEGATGSVYLVATRAGQAAVKIGENKLSLTSEINVLRHFSKVQGNVLGPSLLDVDDIEISGESYPFFCMEYLNGDSLLSFIQKKGTEWAPVLLVQLLGDLDRLHREGWVFGDLKPDNIIVTGPPFRIRWFDVGGTTKIGRAVKEYTEFYDRGYWGLGDRKAEPSYDLFAAAMILIHCIHQSRFEKPRDNKNPLEFLIKQMNSEPSLRPFKKVLTAALKGKYKDAQLMKKDVMAAIENRSGFERQPVSSPAPNIKKSRRNRTAPPPRKIREKSKSYRVEIVLTASFLFLSSILYLVGQWM
ncbi:protein kinase domain-containing protein [Bacillus piscicola]|uniref:protein kinase domain-containing protein n=1 Tax=Bacillus piscicola TaxID=1632684 RepID=UPI001F098D19|nr:protein kinase family protein [Bacillus piscicola]